MLGYHREPKTQEEEIRDIWYNHSEWGRRRKQKIVTFWCFIGAGAVIGALLGLFVR